MFSKRSKAPSAPGKHDTGISFLTVCLSWMVPTAWSVKIYWHHLLGSITSSILVLALHVFFPHICICVVCFLCASFYLSYVCVRACVSKYASDSSSQLDCSSWLFLQLSLFCFPSHLLVWGVFCFDASLFIWTFILHRATDALGLRLIDASL